MSRITIPQHFQELIASNAATNSGASDSICTLEPWLSDETTGLPFFPDFTDHGPNHVNKVLRAGADLVATDAWPLITAEDAAGFVTAVLLHDSAMHLTEEGFLSLIDGKYSAEHIGAFSDTPWPETWNRFFAEARRWDGRKITEVFGSRRIATEADEDYAKYIKRPEEMGDYETWPKAYRRFIGEFVRKYHARIAHEIALYGIPGRSAGGTQIRLQVWNQETCDLFGVLARSHNLALRDTFDYLDTRFNGRVVCRNTHPIFLMVLLRIADFLDVDSNRAPHDLLRIRSLRSPVSRREWDVHHAIVEVRPDEYDREAIFVVAKPTNVRTFLRLRELLTALQGELDVSWAVLGEVYSKQSDQRLDRLGITLRRVRANVDDLPRFIAATQPGYAPVHAAFEAADADLLKLLIEPLYGDRPEVGIRELVQNAVDAVVEMREFCRQKSIEPSELPKWKLQDDADVEVRIHTREDRTEEVPKHWQNWLEVTDTGIGMSDDTIRHYFLKAGASFRRSDAWRRLFEPVDDLPPGSQAKARVIRSGRFGIGVLAAFLLGPEIQVITRYVTAEKGLKFSATIDTDNIELLFVDCPVGTRIRVMLAKTDPFIEEHSSPYFDRQWDWFTLENPRVLRIDKDGRVIDQEFTLPGANDPLSAQFYRINVPGYDDFHWTYSKAPTLTCNGLIIARHSYQSDANSYYGQSLDKLECGLFDFVTPNILVFDSIGNLPLNLQRTELTTRELPFENELIDDLIRDFLAFAFLNAPTGSLVNSHSSPEYYDHGYRYLRFHNTAEIAFLPWFSGKDGVGLVDQYNINAAGIKSVLLVPSDSSVSLLSSFITQSFDAKFAVTDGNNWMRRRNLAALALLDPNYIASSPFSDCEAIGGRVLLTRSKSRELNKHRGLKRSVRDKLTSEWSNRDWEILRTGECPSLSFDTRQLERHKPASEWDGCLAELHVRPRAPREVSHFGRMWSDIFESPTIPYSHAERQSRLIKAQASLREYIAKWQVTGPDRYRTVKPAQVTQDVD